VQKDGVILIQDLRNGHFIRQHMPSSVTAISSQGHVAYQRGSIFRVLSFKKSSTQQLNHYLFTILINQSIE
jgi:hypothetical protein